MRKSLWWAVVVGSLSLLGCAKKEATEDPRSAYGASNEASPERVRTEVARGPSGTSSGGEIASDTTTPPGRTDETGEEESATPPSEGVAAPPANMPLTDGQILQVTEDVDEGEIAQAKAMQAKAETPQVKQLARRLIQQHTKNQLQSRDLEEKIQLSPEESAISRELHQRAQETVRQIQDEAPSDAERTFVDAQIAQHARVLELLSDRLIPSAINVDLKARLEATVKMIEAQMAEARRVQRALGAAPPPAT